jgi:hypothetical protein
MMNNLLRKCAGLFLILFMPVGFVSCVQYEQVSSFFPDGSGKISMSIGIKKSMIEQLEEMAKAMGSEEEMDPLADFTDPKKLAENSEGILAWTKPEVVDDGKWIRVSYTGYFVDINKVKIYQEQEEGGETTKSLAFACTYEKGDGTSTLQLIDDAREKLGEDLEQPEEDDAMREMQIQMMKTMMEGMKIRMAITVPGEILESSGFMSTEGRTCSIEMDDEMMIAMMEEPEGDEAKKMKAVTESKETKITFKNEAPAGEEVDAFKKEMAEAKVAWEKLMKEGTSEEEEEE